MIEARAELWRLHARLAGMTPDDPGYEAVVDEVLELTAGFLHAAGPDRGRLPRPRRSADDRRR